MRPALPDELVTVTVPAEVLETTPFVSQIPMFVEVAPEVLFVKLDSVLSFKLPAFLCEPTATTQDPAVNGDPRAGKLTTVELAPVELLPPTPVAPR